MILTGQNRKSYEAVQTWLLRGYAADNQLHLKLDDLLTGEQPQTEIEAVLRRHLEETTP